MISSSCWGENHAFWTPTREDHLNESLKKENQELKERNKRLEEKNKRNKKNHQNEKEAFKKEIEALKNKMENNEKLVDAQIKYFGSKARSENTKEWMMRWGFLGFAGLASIVIIAAGNGWFEGKAPTSGD